MKVIKNAFLVATAVSLITGAAPVIADHHESEIYGLEKKYDGEVKKVLSTEAQLSSDDLQLKTNNKPEKIINSLSYNQNFFIDTRFPVAP